jgi:hypothetical protein
MPFPPCPSSPRNEYSMHDGHQRKRARIKSHYYGMDGRHNDSNSMDHRALKSNLSWTEYLSRPAILADPQDAEERSLGTFEAWSIYSSLGETSTLQKTYTSRGTRLVKQTNKQIGRSCRKKDDLSDFRYYIIPFLERSERGLGVGKTRFLPRSPFL